MQRIWHDACRRVGIKINLYEGTRHSVASQAINDGIPERLVGDLPGHSDIRVTRKYAHTSIESLRQVLNRKTFVIDLSSKNNGKK